MPSHNPIGSQLTSHGPKKIFSQAKSNKRRDFHISAKEVEVVNGQLLVDGEVFTAQDVVYSLMSQNSDIAKTPEGISIGVLLSTNRNYVRLACEARFTGFEELDEINVKVDDHAIYHINLSFNPHFKTGETFEVDGVKYVALRSTNWALARRALGQRDESQIITTKALISYMLEEGFIAHLGKNIAIESNADSALVVTKR